MVTPETIYYPWHTGCGGYQSGKPGETFNIGELNKINKPEIKVIWAEEKIYSQFRIVLISKKTLYYHLIRAHKEPTT